MTRNEVIEIAHAVATKAGWPWEEPLLIEERRRFILFGRRYWRVTTNIQYAAIGRNVYVQLDDESGEVLSSKYVPTYQGILSKENSETAASPNGREPSLSVEPVIAALKPGPN